MSEEIDHEYTDEVVCPYCGEKASDSWEFDDEGITECGWCERGFRYERHIEVTYCTERIEEPKAGERE